MLSEVIGGGSGGPEKKPAPTRTTRPADTGFWWVGKFQPPPMPAATRTRDPCGLANP